MPEYYERKEKGRVVAWGLLDPITGLWHCHRIRIVKEIQKKTYKTQKAARRFVKGTVVKKRKRKS